MKKSNNYLLTERVNLRSTILAITFFVLGLLLVVWSANKDYWAQNTARQAFVETTGTSLLVTGLITIAWDISGKRAFAEELLSMVNMSRELTAAGILQVSRSFQSRDIDWDNLFSKAVNVDLMFFGSSTWRNHNFKQLEALATKKHTALRVLLPDPNHTNTMQNLADRMNMRIEDQVQKINSSILFFKTLVDNFPEANIQILLVKEVFVFSVFRFDDIAVVSFYSHRKKLVEVPTLLCKTDGIVYKFVMDEIESLASESTNILTKASKSNSVSTS